MIIQSGKITKGFKNSTFQDAGFLGYDAASFGEWFMKL